MEELVRFVVNYEVGIYIVLGIVLSINIKRLIEGWVALQKSTFGLEKEIAQKKIRNSLTFIFLIGLLGVSNFIVVSVASIRYPGLSRLATPTINMEQTATSFLGTEGGMEETPEGLEQTQTAIALTGCIPGQLEWIQPKASDEVSGTVELKGTVNLPNLGFFKYEYRFKGDEIWTPISAGNRPVIEDTFGTSWNTEQLIPGDYFLRLVVSDNANNLIKPCEIQVEVIP